MNKKNSLQSAAIVGTFSSALLLAVGCAPKVMILQIPVVSMTKTSSEGVKGFKEGKPVEAKWCNSEDPIKANDDGSKVYGLIDQVIYKAHKETKADFFVNNRFYQQHDCAYMSANIAVAGEGGAPAGDEGAAPAPAPKGAKKKKKTK